MTGHLASEQQGLAYFWDKASSPSTIPDSVTIIIIRAHKKFMFCDGFNRFNACVKHMGNDL